MHTMIRMIFPTTIYMDISFFWLCQDTNPSPSLDFTWYVWFSITIASLPHRQPIISVVSASRPDCQLILRHFYAVSFLFLPIFWPDMKRPWWVERSSTVQDPKSNIVNIGYCNLSPYHFVNCQRSHFYEFCFNNKKKNNAKQRLSQGLSLGLSIIIHNLSLC